MTSAEIRQSFLDFFAERGHTIVPSSSLMPDSPGLLFTNAGMNQFVPIFLGDRPADVSKWAGARPAKDTRAADTQKCIRAGGKHNDLEDVGFDTYHHTLFEMLGNWSFGDYFKKDSLNWGWQLITENWRMPAKRLFATVYCPADALEHWDELLNHYCLVAKNQGIKGFGPTDYQHFFFGPASLASQLGLKENPDLEAIYWWAEIFIKAKLDPKIHIVPGNRKDNFWMMGDTGPCGPCSEIHFNLLPSDDEADGRKLVNASSPRCIEIWNHVFIQFNANADGSFSPLAAKHVDTGMGFERVAGIHASTAGFTDFTKDPSNYAADVFAPLFTTIAALSQRQYLGTVPTKREGLTEQDKTDIAFRVIADHARCVSCAVADGILPGNEGRNYVIRRILRRGILYGKRLGLTTGFFEQLVAPVVESLGAVFPELAQQQEIIRRVIRSEEESFGRTLDRGLNKLEDLLQAAPGSVLAGAAAFELYDTFGFPLDMTQLLLSERGLTVDLAGFETKMEEQRERGRAAQKKEVIVAATEGGAATDQQPTTFLGYTATHAHGQLRAIVPTEGGAYLVFNQTPFYAEMGGQAGDTGSVLLAGHRFAVTDTVKDKAGRHLHKILGAVPAVALGTTAELAVDVTRRRAISRHHSATHLLHWALRKVLGTHVRQAGTSKTPDRLRFDFSHFEAVTPAQLREIERLVNEKVIDNSAVQSYETEFDQKPEGTLAFFGDKYGKIVRVVDIGGFSRELCGGTHVGTTGEIGLIKIAGESAIAAGTRRIEAVAGQAAYDWVTVRESALAAVGAHLSAGPLEVGKKLEAVLAHQAEIEKKLKAFEQKAAAGAADQLVAAATSINGLNWVRATVAADTPDALRALGAQVAGKIGDGVVVLGAAFGDKATVVAFCSPAAVKAGHQAGKIVSALSLKLGGKGGGKPDFAMGGGREVAQLAEVLTAQ